MTPPRLSLSEGGREGLTHKHLGCFSKGKVTTLGTTEEIRIGPFGERRGWGTTQKQQSLRRALKGGRQFTR